jgi:MinD-like ATPase involved in chromosome partitioning or flagellar assembly
MGMGKIISIHSFRGGTGKSNITANLAALAAINDKRVAVIDLDIQSPGIHVLFGLNEKNMGHTLNEYLHGECSITDVAYSVGEHTTLESGCKKLKGKNLWLIPSSIKSREITRVLREGYDVNILQKGIKSLRKELNLDYLFIDTHPGLNEETLLSLVLTDILLVILRPDQQDFQGTAVTIDVAKGLDVPDLKIVVNKVLSKYDLNQIKNKICETYQVSAAGVLPLTEDLADLGSTDLFSLRYPEKSWSIGLMEVYKNIITDKINGECL